MKQKQEKQQHFIHVYPRYGIPFLVDGIPRYGHVVYLANDQFHNEPKGTKYIITHNDKSIQFFVHYITDSGTQGARIPYTDENLELFKQITTNQPAFIIFRTEDVNPVINGIGIVFYRNHKTKDYGGKYLFWDPKP